MYPTDRSASKSSRTKLTPQRTVSFKVFELEQKSRLKALYPFLSDKQIQCKIRDQWHNLATEEKNKYTKVALKATPVKGKKKSRKYEITLDYSRKRKRCSETNAQKKERPEVCATPEFINPQKLHDFRTKHAETYDNDFTDSPASQEINCDLSIYDWTQKKRIITYKNAAFSVTRATPKIVDQTPYQQAGILKNSIKAEQPGVMKGRVSFSSPADIHQLSDIYSDNFSDSDLDGKLIKRNEYIPSPLLTEPDTRYSDDDDDDAVFITREDKDIEDTDMAVPEIDQEQDRNDTNDSEFNSAQANRRKDKKKLIVTKRKRSEKAQMNKSKISPQGKLIKWSYPREKRHCNRYEKTDKIETVRNQKIDNSAGLMVDKTMVDDKIEQFKSPLPDTSKKGLQRGRKRPKKDERSAEVTTPLGNSTNLGQLVTPTVIQSVDSVEKYTTPQMDEILQQLTLKAASQAPQKQRQNAPNTTDMEKLRALTAGRRVTRSLMAAREAAEKKSPEQLLMQQTTKRNCTDKKRNEDHLFEFDNACNMMDPSGDARSAVKRHGKENDKPEGENVPMTVNTHEDKYTAPQDIDKNSDMEQSTQKDKNSDMEQSTQKEVCKSQRVNKNLRSGCKTEKANSDVTYKNLFCHRHTDQNDESFRSTSDESSNNSQNSEASSAAPATASGLGTNPVLEKALRNLRCTGSDSPYSLHEKIATRSSPGLLSPALSGVSELSSASSSSVPMDQDVDNDKKFPVEMQDKKLLQPSLCQMFRDLTPPYKKTKGQYKTQRMVSSSSTESKNFRQLFQSDDDLLFI